MTCIFLHDGLELARLDAPVTAQTFIKIDGTLYYINGIQHEIKDGCYQRVFLLTPQESISEELAAASYE